jgi:hypothetical protein
MEPRLHEPVEFLHLLHGVGFRRAVLQPTEDVIFNHVARHVRMLGMDAVDDLLYR